MKKLILFLFPLWLIGAEIQWNKSYSQALVNSEKNNKLILVVITTDYCPWCRKLERRTLSDPKIIEKINNTFNAVQITRNKDSYPTKLIAKMVPMSYFINNKEEVIHSFPGYWNSEDYAQVLDDAIAKNERKEGKK